MWNSKSDALLIYAQSDVDKSNTSYYGATGLYLMFVNSDQSIKVEQSKEGPVHDVQWAPNGERFVVAAGTMPCHCTLHNKSGEPLFQFGSAHRNTISWSPHGRFLVLAGFGNLAGEVDFWDTERLRRLGSNTAHCTVSYSWSPDSRSFLTATLAPRMNVDNGIKIFRYNGEGPVFSRSYERLYHAEWRPAQKGLYPDRGPSPKKQQVKADVPATTKPAPYRPPGYSGQMENFMEREVVPAGKVKPGGASASKYVPPSQKRVIPGLPPPQAKAPVKKAPNGKFK